MRVLRLRLPEIQMPKILLVEDDPDLSRSIATFLTKRQMSVDLAVTVSSAKDYMSAGQYDLAIVDWNLPDGCGLSVVGTMKTKHPVLILTTRSAIEDKVAGFDVGADDYLTKPFHPSELLCRVQALLARGRYRAPEQISIGALVLDLQRRRVTRNDDTIDLTPKEFELLEFLMKNAGTVFSKEALLERVWKTDSESTAETVVTTIRRLRKKIDQQQDGTLIRNVFGSGYVIDGE